MLAKSTMIYSFRGQRTGYSPNAGLLPGKNGAFFGVAQGGGANYGGVAYELRRTRDGYREHIIHAFSGGADGLSPVSPLIADASGALYGVTVAGGATCAYTYGGCGTVYKLTPSGSGYTERVLYSFRGGSDGYEPFAALLLGSDGSLYGSTGHGGPGCPSYGGCGVVYKLTPSGSGYSESVLYAFRGGNDGRQPSWPLLMEKNGALFGTTGFGGQLGYGIAFELTPAGSGYTESILHTFGSTGDGQYPWSGFAQDATGAFYGVALAGGTYGSGAVYKVTRSGSSYTESVIFSFAANGIDGSEPAGTPVLAKHGVIYGATQTGGGSGCYSSGPGGCGTVFALRPHGSGYSESVLHGFKGPPNDGALPFGGAILRNGALFGTTFYGGSSTRGQCEGGCGTVFRVPVR